MKRFYYNISNFINLLTAVKAVNRFIFNLLIGLCEMAVKLINIFSLYIALIYVVGCSYPNSSLKHSIKIKDSTNLEFVLPPVPVMLNTTESHDEYLLKHYWECIDFEDTISFYKDEVLEKAWIGYIGLMKRLPIDNVEVIFHEFLVNAETNYNYYLRFINLSEKYLYNPNSLFYNERLYLTVLDCILDSSIDSVKKIRPKRQKELINKNRIGTKANDFVYTLKNNRQNNLYSLNTPYIILFFMNPECSACSDLIDLLKNNVLINEMLDEKKLTILSLYIDDYLDVWKEYLCELSPKWINAYDDKQVIVEHELYDLKAIPSLYLLNDNKIVLLKDCNINTLLEYLMVNSPFHLHNFRSETK